MNNLLKPKCCILFSSGSLNNLITMKMNNNLRQEFYTFGIYGRDFNLDVAEEADDGEEAKEPEETEGAASTLQITLLLIVGLIFVHASDNFV